MSYDKYLYQHRRRVTLYGERKCPKCGQWTDRLRAHIKAEHGRKDQAPAIKRQVRHEGAIRAGRTKAGRRNAYRS